MKSTATQLGAPDSKRTFNWVDLLIFAGILGLLWSILHFGKGMTVRFDATSQSLSISSDIRSIPYYIGRTLIRMWIAFGFSLVFTFVVGYAAAKSRVARTIILPFLDIMQSIPVLSFLTIFVTFFVSLFPGNMLGVEFASILTVFTGQVWNMAFGFYHSMVTTPQDLHDAATCFRLSARQRFLKLEVPASMHSLIWNAMMSFGGGWFAVSASEAITVLGKNIELPGLGSYMANAVGTGDNQAAFWAIVAMLLVILATDQLVWRPLLVWADKFKMELTESAHPPKSWFYDFLRRAYLFEWIEKQIVSPAAELFDELRLKQRARRDLEPARSRRIGKYIRQVIGGLLLVGLLYQVLLGVIAGYEAVYRHISLADIAKIVGLGFITLLRVVAVTVF